jgi:hypothetical protein
VAPTYRENVSAGCMFLGGRSQARRIYPLIQTSSRFGLPRLPNQTVALSTGPQLGGLLPDLSRKIRKSGFECNRCLKRRRVFMALLPSFEGGGSRSSHHR